MLTKSKKGFTIFEITVVMVIMLIIATVAVIQIRSYDALKLDAAAQRVAADIRYVQQLVIDSAPAVGYILWGNPIQFDAVINFNPANETYRVITLWQEYTDCSGYPPSDQMPFVPIIDPSTQEPFEININQEYKGVLIDSVSATDISFSGSTAMPARCRWWCLSSPDVVCTYLGELAPAGETITLSYGTRTRTVRIVPMTGRVTIE
jgi:prepilin-type N-terminal cleavage/methylation domain-containing protein